MNTNNFKLFLQNISNNKIKYFIVFDLECTGLNIGHDRITQISAIKYDINTIKPVSKINKMLNPGNEVNIGLGAYMKTGYKIEDLKNNEKFIDIADDIYNFFGNEETAIVGYNIKSFDIPFLNAEFVMCGHNKIDFTNKYIYDVYEVERDICKMSQTGVFERYFEKTPDEIGLNPHDAMSDVKMCLMIALEQSNKYNNIINENDIVKYKIIDNTSFIGYIKLENTIFNDINNKYVLCFTKGKYRNCPIKLVNLYDKSYIDWCFSERSPLDVNGKILLRKELYE